MACFKSAFSVKKAPQRKHVSRSPLKLPADEMYRELGPKYELIDIRLADRKVIFDLENGDWNTAGAESLGGTTSSGTAQKIRKTIEVLQEENNMLKLKADVLLNLVAETVAELSNQK